MIVSVWAIFGRPHAALLALSVTAAGVHLWLGIEAHQAAKLSERALEARETYRIDTSTPGDRTIRILPLPLVSGLQVRPIRKDRTAPSLEDVTQVRWKARTPHESWEGVKVDGGWIADMKEDRGEPSGVDVTVTVDDASRPILDQLELEVVPSSRVRANVAMLRDINRFGTWMFATLALVALVAIASQASRFARNRRRPSGFPAEG